MTADADVAAVLAARSAVLARLFGRYMTRYVARHFHAVRIARGGLPRLPEGRPAIVYTNHPSWWDPAVFMALATLLFPGRPAWGPMDAAALEKYGIFRRIGIFGIEPGTRRGAARFLRVATAVLADPAAMLWVTAEGAFTDPRARPVRLRPGLAHLARRLPDAVLVPLALEYPFWTERFPEALLRFGDPIPAENHHPAGNHTTGDWTAILEARLTETLDALAADAMTRDPARFTTLLSGAAGIGGGYDLWRRLRAALAGRRFSAAHDDSGEARHGP